MPHHIQPKALPHFLDVQRLGAVFVSLVQSLADDFKGLLRHDQTQ
jgi:hypothetical protein